MSKIKVACLKFDGLSSGGTEKYIQTISTLLDKSKYDVDYFYTEKVDCNVYNNVGMNHIGPNIDRLNYLKSNGVNLIKVEIGNRYNYPPYEWVCHNLFNLFKEDNYDIIQIARGGYTEYPFNQINRTKIIDSVHGDMGEDKPNIKKVILLCEWQANIWGSRGGNLSKAEIIPSLVYVPEKNNLNFREELSIPKDAFVYGFHQASNPNIFSPISLAAYSLVNNDNNYFLILGGSQKHRDQAIGMKNVIFLDFSSDINIIHKFLSTIDVFAHSRSDGEVCSAAIIEAMYHGKPIISHKALNMGHLEQIDGCGRVCEDIDEYVKEMRLLENNKDYYLEKSENTIVRYYQKYDYNKIEKKINNLYDYVSKL